MIRGRIGGFGAVAAMVLLLTLVPTGSSIVVPEVWQLGDEPDGPGEKTECAVLQFGEDWILTQDGVPVIARPGAALCGSVRISYFGAYACMAGLPSNYQSTCDYNTDANDDYQGVVFGVSITCSASSYGPPVELGIDGCFTVAKQVVSTYVSHTHVDYVWMPNDSICISATMRAFQFDVVSERIEVAAGVSNYCRGD